MTVAATFTISDDDGGAFVVAGFSDTQDLVTRKDAASGFTLYIPTRHDLDVLHMVSVGTDVICVIVLQCAIMLSAAVYRRKTGKGGQRTSPPSPSHLSSYSSTRGASEDSVVSAPRTLRTGSSKITGTDESLTGSRGLVLAL